MYIKVTNYSTYGYNIYDPRDNDIYVDDKEYAEEHYHIHHAYDFIDENDYWDYIEEAYCNELDLDDDEMPTREEIQNMAFDGSIDGLIKAWLFRWRLEEFAEWLFDKYGA